MTRQQPGLVVKLRPTGPWRIGPDSGDRHSVDLIYHSDSLYAAVTGTMRLLGHQEDWLLATAQNADGSAVRFSSCFPFINEIGFVIPPRNVWPPPDSTRVRWKSARFIPLGLVGSLLAGKALEEEPWSVDGVSQCLVPAGRAGPFRTALRTAAAVDRLTGRCEPHATACLDFAPGAGFWGVIAFADEDARARWSGPVQAAIRWLADSGFGGERSRGWGHASAPEFVEGTLPDMILPPPPVAEGSSEVPESGVAGGYWLLSLFTPGPRDAVDWSGGNYSLLRRGGRVDSPVRSGDAKKLLRMVEEGSVLLATADLAGAAPDVAPDGFPHPVYRAGFAMSIPVPASAPVPVAVPVAS
jgi:CRISPR type III-A-associated RAMP protein Csm4